MREVGGCCYVVMIQYDTSILLPGHPSSLRISCLPAANWLVRVNDSWYRLDSIGFSPVICYVAIWYGEHHPSGFAECSFMGAA
jgi:hypothetical protein